MWHLPRSRAEVLAFSKTNRACDDSIAKEVMLSTIICPNSYIIHLMSAREGNI